MSSNATICDAAVHPQPCRHPWVPIKLTMRPLILVFLMTLGLGAQGILRIQDSCAWLSPHELLVVNSGDPEDSRAMARIFRTGKPAQPIPPPKAPPSAFACWGQATPEGLYGISASAETLPQGRGIRITVQRFESQTRSWASIGTLFFPRAFRPVVLNEDLILGLAQVSQTFVQDHRSFPFGIFRRDAKGEFHLESMFEAGLKRPIFDEKGGWNYPSLQKAFMFPQTARSAEHLVFGTGHGWFWIFDADKGSLKRIVSLYKGADETHLKEDLLWDGAVLGFQPKPDGQVLISALDEEALFRGGLFKDLPSKEARGKPGSVFVDRVRTFEDRLLQVAPRVDWFLLDPAEGQIREELPPRGLPSIISTSKALSDFNWMFKPDGNLALDRKSVV